MKEKLIFQKKTVKESLKDIQVGKERKILNFLNLHDLYQLKKEQIFREAVFRKESINFIDGFVISVYLSFMNLKRIPRARGPIFTKEFLSNPELSKNKKHFFIGLEKKDLKDLQKKFLHLKSISAHNLPYIKRFSFPNSEIKKISKMINKEKPDYVWVGVGSPKQNILSMELYEKTKAKYFFNVGAALDFILEKKKRAPKLVQNLGVEWLYRLVTDFKYSKRKVWRSFVSLRYLSKVRLKKYE